MSGMEKKDLPHGRCNPCEFAEILVGTGSWFFLGCCHPPYKGKWVAEIKDCPKERMEGDEMCAAAAEKLKEALSQPVEAENILQREMRKRNMTEADILEYMKFEDACALKGFTLKGLLEAGEKKKAKRPYWALDRQGKSTWKNCPCCQQEVTTVNKCCPTCGQKLDWSGLT